METTFTKQELIMIGAWAKRHSQEAVVYSKMATKERCEKLMNLKAEYDRLGEKARAMLREMK